MLLIRSCELISLLREQHPQHVSWENINREAQVISQYENFTVECKKFYSKCIGVAGAAD